MSFYCTHIDLNFAKVYGLAQSGGSGQLTGIENPSSSGDNLTTTTMNGISVQCHIINIETNTTHVFVAQNTLQSFKKKQN